MKKAKMVDDANHDHSSAEKDEFLLATVRFCFIQEDPASSGSNLLHVLPPEQQTQEWIWLRSLCVHTSYRGQGWSRKLLEMALPALFQQHPNIARTPVFCFAKAALGSQLYMPFGFRPVTANLGRRPSLAPQPNNCDDDETAETKIPNSLRQRYSSIVRRMSANQGRNDQAVDLECFGYYYYNCDDDTAAISISNSRPMPPPRVNLLIVQHERETVRKTGTARLVLESSYNNDSILGLNVAAMTWAGRSDTENIEQLLREKQQSIGDNMNNNSLVLLWTGGGTADDILSSFLATAPCNDEPNNTTETISSEPDPTFILLDGTWQETWAMFRKIPLLWNLPRLSLRATQASRYRLRQDYGWKKKFSGDNKNGQMSHVDDIDNSDNDGASENTLLCTAEVVAELLQQTGNTDGATTVRNRLETFMAQLRPVKKEIRMPMKSQLHYVHFKQ